MTRLISTAEVKKHRHKDSVWIIIHQDVYDVTSFLEEHPGGEDTLLEVAGQDGTQGFEDVGHSDDARELMKKYKIGTLPPEEKNKVKPCPCCPHLPKIDKPEKTWRTYDGSPSRGSSRSVPAKLGNNVPSTQRHEGRVQSITVPRESSNPNLKWALVALAGALVLGFVLKKVLSNK